MSTRILQGTTPQLLSLPAWYWSKLDGLVRSGELSESWLNGRARMVADVAGPDWSWHDAFRETVMAQIYLRHNRQLGRSLGIANDFWDPCR